MVPFSEYTDARDHCTFRIGGKFRYFTEIRDKEELPAALDFSGKKGLPFLVFGEGSNLIFGDGILNILAAKMSIKGIEITGEDDDSADVTAGAGVIWDELVEHAIRAGYSGLEALSAIPGSVGASPVQNVGAYGSEAGDTIRSVEVFDRTDGRIKTLSHAGCRFGYRDSLFKREGKGRYIITGVTFRLSKQPPRIPHYPDIMEYFRERDQATPTLSEIRDVITKIRWSKLPDPAVLPNAGSFFKNHVAENRMVLRLKEAYPDVRIFPVDEDHSKIPAGWLIEKSGLKGKSFGSISVYEKNALVLVNKGGATSADLKEAGNFIVNTVRAKFGITLEQEPDEVKGSEK